MARPRNAGWNPCEELKNEGKKESSSLPDDEGEKSISIEPREEIIVKSLARADKLSKARFKSMLPKLEPFRVRRFRIPRYEAVILELEEEGFRESAAYVSMLLELDEKTAAAAAAVGSAGSARRTALRNEKELLQRLSDGLRSAEIAKKNGKLSIRAVILIKMAIHLESCPEWFWIARRLYASCLKIGEKADHQIFNVVKYLYGRFLLDKMNDTEEALDRLDQARIASEGKTWRVSKILGLEGGETLHRECCVLLHKALLSLSRRIREEDPQIAEQAAMYALERATDLDRDEAIASALYELGKSQLSAGRIKTALGNLSKFLAISKRIPDPEGICDAHMELAFARKELEDKDGVVKHLGLLRQCAMRHKLRYKLAQAHFYTGEYLLNESRANLATPHLDLALGQFVSLGKNNEADRARCAAGISKAQETMDRYVDLISNCRTGNTEAIIKICDWKNKRVPFCW